MFYFQSTIGILATGIQYHIFNFIEEEFLKVFTKTIQLNLLYSLVKRNAQHYE
jgi:hypothetical protein